LARAYIARPTCTVVGAIRDDTAAGVAELKAAPRGDGSRLLLVNIESSSTDDAKNAVKAMEAAGIDHIDILIPNAGVSPDLEPIETVDLSILTSAFSINAIGPLSLYQACYGLLRKSKSPKFTPITSAAGSISGMERGRTFVAPSYCISKAALNWITLYAKLEWVRSTET
jgi:NAD(P)-dependent dehydrogenase (short-subunit alcohol dehydrogenase family)